MEKETTSKTTKSSNEKTSILVGSNPAAPGDKRRVADGKMSADAGSGSGVHSATAKSDKTGYGDEAVGSGSGSDTASPSPETQPQCAACHKVLQGCKFSVFCRKSVFLG